MEFGCQGIKIAVKRQQKNEQFIDTGVLRPIPPEGSFLATLGGDLGVRVELVCEGLLGGGQIRADLIRGRDVGLDAGSMVHGPPQVVLEPVAGAEVVHVDDPFADGLAFGVEGLDGDVEVVRLGLLVFRGHSGHDGNSAVCNARLNLLHRYSFSSEIDIIIHDDPGQQSPGY